jgi:hypothetical protein
MNWFFRVFIRFDQVEGSTLKGIEDLKLVVAGGRYYAPMAKALLALIYLREDQPEEALGLLRELERDFPGNRLFRTEVARVEGKIAQAGTAGG